MRAWNLRIDCSPNLPSCFTPSHFWIARITGEPAEFLTHSQPVVRPGLGFFQIDGWDDTTPSTYVPKTSCARRVVPAPHRPSTLSFFGFDGFGFGVGLGAVGFDGADVWAIWERNSRQRLPLRKPVGQFFPLQ